MQCLGEESISAPLSGKNVEGDASSSRILLSLTSGGRKIKELNLITEDCLCVMQKSGGDKGISQQNS